MCQENDKEWARARAEYRRKEKTEEDRTNEFVQKKVGFERKGKGQNGKTNKQRNRSVRLTLRIIGTLFPLLTLINLGTGVRNFAPLSGLLLSFGKIGLRVRGGTGHVGLRVGVAPQSNRVLV
jgi:hypothetical protein